MKRFCLCLLFLPTLGIALGTPRPTYVDVRGASTAELPSEDATQEPTSIFGEPVVVNGRRISDLAIKRFLIYGPGETVLETDRLALLIEKELEFRAANMREELLAGRALADLTDAERADLEAKVDEAMAKFRLSEDYYQWVADGRRANFEKRFPTLDYEIEMARTYGAFAWLDLQTRRALEFDQCFFPGDPDQWPDVTKEALWANSSEVDLVADMKQSWETRKMLAERNGARYMRREEEAFFSTVRGLVIDLLGTLTSEESMVEGLPEELVLRVSGSDWEEEFRTEAIWERVGPYIDEHEIRVAKRWLALMSATEERLAKDGHLVPMEDHLAHLERVEKQIRDALFSMEFIAISGHGFPSTRAFRAYLRAFESFRGVLAAQGYFDLQKNGQPSPKVVEYFKAHRRVLAGAPVDAELLLVGAFDLSEGTWKPNGWVTAEKMANELRAAIDAHQAKIAANEVGRHRAIENGENWTPAEVPAPFEEYWSDLLDQHSDYWDPPMPAVGKAPPANTLTDKGRFGSQVRADLQRSIGATNFYRILTGVSIADHVAGDLQVGSVAGPFRGPLGYYIVYLRTRGSTTRDADLKKPAFRELVEDSLLIEAFTEYAQEALRSADTSGVPAI